MSEWGTSCDSLPVIVDEAPDTERELHRQLLLDNIEFLIETLTAEHTRRQRLAPVGCPEATPALLARRLSTGSDSCRYTVVQREHNDTTDAGCPCEDPLLNSADPLDAVAAVVLTGNVSSLADLFFERVPRTTIARLRDAEGSWEDIAELDTGELTAALDTATPRKGISDDRVHRLESLLEAVKESHYTDGITLRDFSSVPYSTLADFLSSIPGIAEADAWWLVQTAFDKPVWPADPEIDALLCSLGLLNPDELSSVEGRRSDIEDDLTDRQIPALYRALATHAVAGGADVCGETCEIRKFLLSHRLREQRAERNGPTVVDLFAGAGGLSCGLSRAGYDIRWAIDNNPDAVATYRLNHPEIPHKHVVCDDVQEVDLPARIRDVVSSPDLIVGGPPCQSLSQAGYRSRRAQDNEYSILDDDRTTLYTQYVETVDELRPKAIVMENVEGMINEVGDTGVRVIDWVLNDLVALGERGEGYHVDFRLQDMSELGVPQQRQRVFLVGIRTDLVNEPDVVTDIFEDLQLTESPRTILQGLSGLPRLRRGEGGRVLPETMPGNRSRYVSEHQLHAGTQLCFNHRAREHPMEKDQILFDEALSPGTTSWDVKYDSDGEYAEYIEYDVGTEENPRFKDKYRMLEWDQPSPTIVAHLAKDANAYVLPDYYEHAQPDAERADAERNRGLTPREAARLQSFPDEYIFLGSFTSWFRQIGNAVPPIAGELLGKSIISVLKDAEQTERQITENMPVAETISDD